MARPNACAASCMAARQTRYVAATITAASKPRISASTATSAASITTAAVGRDCAVVCGRRGTRRRRIRETYRPRRSPAPLAWRGSFVRTSERRKRSRAGESGGPVESNGRTRAGEGTGRAFYPASLRRGIAFPRGLAWPFFLILTLFKN